MARGGLTLPPKSSLCRRSQETDRPVQRGVPSDYVSKGRVERASEPTKVGPDTETGGGGTDFPTGEWARESGVGRSSPGENVDTGLSLGAGSGVDPSPVTDTETTAHRRSPYSSYPGEGTVLTTSRVDTRRPEGSWGTVRPRPEPRRRAVGSIRVPGSYSQTPPR